MSQRYNLLLIESDSHRRAAICHGINGDRFHVEPFEDSFEIINRWPTSGTILVEDDNGNVPHIIEHMTKQANWLPVICYSERPTTHNIVRAITEGAIDYLQWPFTASDLDCALTTANNNVVRMSAFRVREMQARGRLQKLTRREREVLEGVANGLSNRLIGERLSISPRTVEIHRANMLNKMGASHTSEAIRIAIEATLVA
jgi:FixJ family two-component response regulator